jgi:hypothetical protein
MAFVTDKEVLLIWKGVGFVVDQFASKNSTSRTHHA